MTHGLWRAFIRPRDDGHTGEINRTVRELKTFREIRFVAHAVTSRLAFYDDLKTSTLTGAVKTRCAERRIITVYRSVSYEYAATRRHEILVDLYVHIYVCVCV